MEEGAVGQSRARLAKSNTAASAEAVWDRAANAFEAWRSGEPQAMDELVRTLTPVLWHVVRAYGLAVEQSQDVVQATWLIFVSRCESIADPRAVAAWLMTTARREAWRVAKRGSRTVSVSDDVLETVLDDDASAEELAVTRDEHGWLWACVKTLSERCQRLLRIVAFEQRPDYARIAIDLEMPVGSIGPTRSRCLSKLRELLESRGGVP
ncbi:MAG: RNA polymerase sigma factor [Rhodoglobus sp.]